jgi:uncharacterized protein (TIGR02217 family)
MAFIETPRFPDNISRGASGGPGYQTDVVVVSSGHEQRNITWPLGRARYDVAHGIRTQAQMDVLIAFFRSMKGKAHGFRFKDWNDFGCTSAQGLLGTGNGTGAPVHQIGKRYVAGALNEVRTIRKPVSGQVAVQRNGGAVTVGAGAGQISIDSTTGLITFVADAQAAASSITVGATTTVVLASNPGTLIAGQLLYLSGVTGAGAALVNDRAHTINSVTGTGPFTFVLATVTTGATITLGSGLGRRFPQAADALTWSGQFDVPVRFDIDQMAVSIEAFQLYTWGQIPLIEIRV